MNPGLQYDLQKIKQTKTWKEQLGSMLAVVSIIVIIAVFWWLKLTGITMAGEAFCGYDEHSHTAECTELVLVCDISETGEDNQHEHTEECYITNYICGTDEHIHNSLCYSDINADKENAGVWEATLPYIAEEVSTKDCIVEIARSQMGYTESINNFTVDADGVRRGYTRYGEWYGNPYGKWSVMFVSFCLNYAGLDDMYLGSGADAMIVQWAEADRYFDKGEYTPIEGDVVFLDKNENGTADSAAIIIEISDEYVTVIEGDCEDAVAETMYYFDDSVIVGYGLSSPGNSLIIVQPVETEPVETEPVETEPIETEPIETEPIETEPVETEPVETEPVETEPVETESVETEPVETEPVETEPVETEPIETEPIETEPIETEPIETEPIETEPVETEPVETEPIETEPIETEPVETEPVETEPVETEPIETELVKTEPQLDNNLKIDANPAADVSPMAVTRYVWLDGTNGGIRTLSGSDNTRYSVEEGSIIKLPTEWKSPAQYGYVVRGWYDVTNSVYYRPGDEVEVTGNMVFYTDWVPATYDVGRFNASTSDTISTNHIITTRVYDFNYLFNVLSSNATVTVSANSHSESWRHVESGTVPYKNAETLDFAFKDNDSNGKISLTSGRSYHNDYHNATTVSSGILDNNPALIDVLFGTDNSFDPETGEGVIGKTYLGTGDYMFQIMENPESDYYGYYYFDSKLHAASYNRSEQRFYVYDYLARSSDSAGQSGEDKYSDFLPLNSPYANTNGKNTDTYTYAGQFGEYTGINHYEYDMSYSDTDAVGAKMAFGLSMEMEFYLPDTPGNKDANGNWVNLDLYGNEMSYTFSGDDDLWVLVDGEVRLDIGGIHQIVSGTINFSTGIVTVNGSQTGTIYDLEPGDHTLTIYYLERGSSQSNCAMYFNLTPRYNLTIQKEDVLTQELLDGAEFSFYNDPDCTDPALLWESEEDYDNGAPSTNSFTVEDGFVQLWGISPNKTYYIKETRPPTNPGYERAHGVIEFEFDIKGNATVATDIVEETGEDGVSPGYTVHDYWIDTENQAAYITVTNAQSWVKDVTTVQVAKIWEDSISHSDDYVSVYLTVTDADGAVRRIRETILGDENEWTYTWTNLPKHTSDGVTEVKYGVEESYTPGYSSTVEKVDKIIINDETWESLDFVNGEEYLLKSNYGYLSASSASSQTLKWITEEEAKADYGGERSLSTWVASVSGNVVKLKNKNGQVLSYNNGNNSNRRYFYLTTSSTNYQSLTYSDSGNGYKLSYKSGFRNYYISALNSSNYLSSTTSSSSALVITPMILHTETTEIEVEGIAYTVTNTPLDVETSLKVTKYWDTGLAVNVPYETARVTVKLIADGKETGRSVTLSHKNNWTDTFLGLPYQDDFGNVISYTVVESWDNEDWDALYGEVKAVGSGVPTYETTVTNVYRFGHGYELPSTGGYGDILWVFSGLSLMIGSLVMLYIIKRRSLRRKC